MEVEGALEDGTNQVSGDTSSESTLISITSFETTTATQELRVPGFLSLFE